MYYWLNQIVTQVGLGESIVLLLASLVGVVYTVSVLFGRVPGRLEWLCAWLPLAFAVNASFAGWRDHVDLMGHLHARAAVNAAQEALLANNVQMGIVRGLVLGVASSLLLLASSRMLFVPWAIRRISGTSKASTNRTSQVDEISASAGKEKHAEPV